MKALVTGANGFCGSALVEQLLEEGWTVRCLTRKNSSFKYLDKSKIETREIDYLDYTTLIEPLKEIDVVFHLAGVTKGLSKDDFWRGNVIPTENLCKAVVESGVKLKRFVLASSQTAGGPSMNLENPINEENYIEPIELYGMSKRAGEDALLKFKDKFPYTILRLSSVYGPRDVDFFELFKQLYAGINMYYGDRYKYISIIHVKDLVEGIIKSALHKKTKNELYYLCNTEPVKWEDIHNITLKVVGKKGINITLPFFTAQTVCFFGSLWMKITKKPVLLNLEKIKLSKPQYWVCSNKKARDDFDFSPKLSLEEGIKDTISWYVENGWLKGKK